MMYIDYSEMKEVKPNVYYLEKQDMYFKIENDEINRAWIVKPDDFGEMTRSNIKLKTADKILIDNNVGFE